MAGSGAAAAHVGRCRKDAADGRGFYSGAETGSTLKYVTWHDKRAFMWRLLSLHGKYRKTFTPVFFAYQLWSLSPHTHTPGRSFEEHRVAAQSPPHQDGAAVSVSPTPGRRCSLSLLPTRTALQSQSPPHQDGTAVEASSLPLRPLPACGGRESPHYAFETEHLFHSRRHCGKTAASDIHVDSGRARHFQGRIHTI